MRFSVPQFITIEDRLRFGFLSFTFPQLFIAFGAFLICFAIYKIFGGLIALFLSATVVILAFIIGWVKINNKYIYSFLPKLVLILLSEKKYVWKEEVKVTTKYIKSPTLEKYIELEEIEEEPKKEVTIFPTEKKEEKEVNQPLSNYVKKAIERGYNPFNPYINFPIPKFPKRRW